MHKHLKLQTLVSYTDQSFLVPGGGLSGLWRPLADLVCLFFSGGDGRLGGEQVPERGAQAVNLRPLQKRVGQTGQMGSQTSGLLRQRALACPSATTLVSLKRVANLIK